MLKFLSSQPRNFFESLRDTMSNSRHVQFNPAVNAIFYTPPPPATPVLPPFLQPTTQPQVVQNGYAAPATYVGNEQTGAGGDLNAISGQLSVHNTFAQFQYSTTAPNGQGRHDATLPTQGVNASSTTQTAASYPVDHTLITPLLRFPIPWDIRARGPTSLASEPILDAFAFADGAKSCLLFFTVPNTNDFHVKRWVALEQPLRVRDIITAINDALLEPRPSTYIPSDHAAFPGAIAARQYRTADDRRGPDPPEITWRRVDAWPGQALYFYGLQRVHPTERHFVVLLRPAVPQ
ncbi:hypothetical protein GY45DRAFT_717861 [Cubamyces sp. BRFM 1775]|nr:hypothetical protein GY45DRAFT_717861 [Cubamyces sp. BRFM 1775]